MTHFENKFLILLCINTAFDNMRYSSAKINFTIFILRFPKVFYFIVKKIDFPPLSSNIRNIKYDKHEVNIYFIYFQEVQYFFL